MARRPCLSGGNVSLGCVGVGVGVRLCVLLLVEHV